VSEQTNSSGVILNAGSLVPIGAIVTFVLATWWLAAQLSELREAITRLDARIARLEEKFDDSSSNDWTWSDHERWSAQMQALNPTIRLPPPEPRRK
jgi:hypothetical protein